MAVQLKNETLMNTEILIANEAIHAIRFSNFSYLASDLADSRHPVNTKKMRKKHLLRSFQVTCVETNVYQFSPQGYQ